MHGNLNAGSNQDGSETVLMLTSDRNEAASVASLLDGQRLHTRIYADLPALTADLAAELAAGLHAGPEAVVIDGSALRDADLSGLADRVAAQPPWSDLPFILLAEREAGGNPAAAGHGALPGVTAALGNVMVLERPISRSNLLSAVRVAVRARQRQRQVRGHIAVREQASAALAESEDRFRSVADSAPVLIWTTGPDKEHTWFNKPWLDFTGRRLEQELGSGWTESLHQDDSKTCLDTFTDSFDRRVTFRMDYRMRRSDGDWRMLDGTGVPRYDERGAFMGYIGSCVDVTEHRETEAALRASEERFRQIAEAVDDVFWISDIEPASGRMVNHYASPAYERIWGRTVAALRERDSDWLDGIHPDDRPEVEQLLFAHALAGQYDVEYRVVRPDGAVRWVRDRGFPVRGGKGNQVAGIATDISQSRLMQEALENFNATLEARVIERTAALAASEAERRQGEAALAHAQKMEAVGHLSGGIAHDFNNLLTAVLGSLELLGRKVQADPGAVRLVDGATQAAERGAKLCKQMLAFSRTEKLDLRPVEVDRLLAAMDGLLTPAAGQLVHYDVKLGDAGWVRSDANQLELAVLNLVLNARDAVEGSGQITVSTRSVELRGRDAQGCAVGLPAGRYAEIQVSDTGSGMPPEVVVHAMEPFFTTKQVGKGSGLGLAQVYGIARQSGGDVRISSVVGQGTAVRILLPSVSPPAEGAGTPCPTPAMPGDGRPRQVLLVDDDEAVRTILAEGLEMHGFAVLQAADGPAALAILHRGSPVDAAVMDFAMPGMTGAELAGKARRLRPGLPLVFASGYADSAAVDAVPDAVFLHKPVTLAGLAGVLREMIGGVQASIKEP